MAKQLGFEVKVGHIGRMGPSAFVFSIDEGDYGFVLRVPIWLGCDR